MNNTVKGILIVIAIIAYYVFIGPESFTCDYCGKKSTGTHYTITNDYNKDMCSSCYSYYHSRGWVD